MHPAVGRGVGLAALVLTLWSGLAAAREAPLSNGPQSPPQIVSGLQARPGEFPYIVSIQTAHGSHLCGGSLVAPRWVLTAAHCVVGVDIAQIRLLVGLYDQKNPKEAELFIPKRSVIHQLYKLRSDGDFDFALIELNGRSNASPISVTRDEVNIPKEAELAPRGVTAGWGNTLKGGALWTYPNILMKIDIPLVSKERCTQYYGRYITSQMLCGGSGVQGFCDGDSGGPLVSRNRNGGHSLIGVVSATACGNAWAYGVFAKVDGVIVDWISRIVGGGPDGVPPTLGEETWVCRNGQWHSDRRCDARSGACTSIVPQESDSCSKPGARRKTLCLCLDRTQ